MPEKISVQCCIAGGGPAGMMLGYLLARAGAKVLVFEKHADFLRDFRGDTIHPSTLEVMDELGLLEEFLRLPHQEVDELNAQVGQTQLTIADFRYLPTRCRFIALMPQWNFLNFLADQAAGYPGFGLMMEAEVSGLIEESGRVTGVEAKTPNGAVEVRADLIVGADGRHSIVREKAGLKVKDLGAPMDVLWFRISRSPEDPVATMGRFDKGRIFITLNRGEYWQCGYVIAKGQFEEMRRQEFEIFRAEIIKLAPYTRDRVRELRGWDDVKLLTVRVDRLLEWFRPGLLCIGDAAHAMSPVGGVGINLAIQDAVAAANVLFKPLREGQITTDHLRGIQKRRELPTRVTQRLQVMVQRRIIARVLGESGSLKPPLAVRLFAAVPLLRRIPARIVGVGIRPEHVTPEVTRS
ncbi:MAG TPA: FAD-dependent oxidoreductase [Candidatus Binatia bacterium]|jgi:2-polyprenyl-6-methoxyphenol hydroxylase-like FAD-dependent oxidoreductase|nr:FAD-dependent oxidoreductase [Candidatus Binatia bacterium]